MKSLSRTSALVAGLLVAGSASAGNMYINLGSNAFDVYVTGFIPPSTVITTAYDANSTTGVFNEFGFNQLLATSVYTLDGSGALTGAVYDTNYASDFSALGIPRTGIALDGTTTVELKTPLAGQMDLDGLEPVTGLGVVDGEGFGLTWGLSILYKFNGTLGTTGPSYTSGTFEVIFNDQFGSTTRTVMKGNLTGSNIQAANLDLFFDLTWAETGFLWAQGSDGAYRDASLSLPSLILDTNVNPPIPTADQLLPIVTADGAYAVRQTTLDGTITTRLPEPSSISLIGLGLLGFFGLSRRRNRS